MPIRLRVDPLRKVNYTTATGVITDAELRQACANVVASPDYDPSADHIVDGHAIERLEVSPETLQEAAQIFARTDRRIPVGTRSRVAIVAPTDATFGIARMYEAYRTMAPLPKRYLVCRTMEEARRWLGLPEKEPAAPAFDATTLDVDWRPRVVPVEFNDPAGVRWAVVPRLLGSASDPVPDGFVFSSEHGERRFLRWDPRDFFSPREVNHETWRELLRSATVVT
jgi:hypothetical protein